MTRTYTSHGISIRIDRARFAHLSDTQFYDLLDLYCSVEDQCIRRARAAQYRQQADHIVGFAELNGRNPTDGELLRSLAFANPGAYGWRELSAPPR